MRGKLPFSERNEKKLLKLIRNSDFEFDDEWENISENCKDFIKKLLVKNPKDRMTANEALKHPWITDNFTVNNSQICRK